MSLISNPFLAARSPAPLPTFSSIHHVRRQVDIDTEEIPDLPFTCNGKTMRDTAGSGDAFWSDPDFENAFVCPAVEQILIKCMSGGKADSPDSPVWATMELEDMYPNKALCLDMCNGFFTGDIYDIQLTCIAKTCKDAAKNVKQHREYLAIAAPMYLPICKDKFGMTGPEKARVESKPSESTADKSDKADKPADSSDNADKPADTSSNTSDTSSNASGTNATDSSDGDSSARRLGAGGSWGASVVVALVFGSVFSGLLA